MDERKITRRGFLDIVIGSGALVLGAVMTGTVVKYLLPPMKESGKAGEVQAAGTTELAVGQAKKFDMNGSPALLVHMPTGYFALSAVCTHLGCIVEWDDRKQQVVCPCHNGTFDYRGNILGGPPPKPLPSYQAAVKGSHIMVSGGASNG